MEDITRTKNTILDHTRSNDSHNVETATISYSKAIKYLRY